MTINKLDEGFRFADVKYYETSHQPHTLPQWKILS